MGFLTGCDKIDEPYLKVIDGSGPGPVENEKVILLEDYTGHKCPNCPAAAEIAHTLSVQHGSKLVLITIHAGWYASPDADGFFTRDFRTPEGNAWNSNFGIDMVGNPSGMINRIEYNGKLVMYKDDWQAAVSAVIEAEPRAGITITNSYEPSSRTLTCNLETTFLETLDGTYNLCVVLTESGIVAPQQDQSVVVENYVHNHVLRTSLNGAWGMLVGDDGSAVKDVKLVNEYSLVIPEDYVVENCAVVAFVYDTDTDEIIQAAEEEVVD